MTLLVLAQTVESHLCLHSALGLPVPVLLRRLRLVLRALHGKLVYVPVLPSCVDNSLLCMAVMCCGPIRRKGLASASRSS
jgi:hypothetical protein